MRMQKSFASQTFGGLCFIAMGCLFFALGFWQLLLDRKFDVSVGRAQATIERLWTSSGGKGGTSFNVRCQYPIGSDQVQQSEITVSKATYCQVRPGDIVPVKYLLADTSISRVDTPQEERWHWHKDAGITVFAFVFSGVGIFVVWLGRRQQAR
jgi:hypothetical protein